MTEAQWRYAVQVQPMLEFLRGRMTARQERLFACACCRRIWPLIRDEKCRTAVEAAERHADGAAVDLAKATAGAWEVVDHYDTRFDSDRAGDYDLIAGHAALAAWYTAAGTVPPRSVADGKSDLYTVEAADAAGRAVRFHCISLMANERKGLRPGDTWASWVDPAVRWDEHEERRAQCGLLYDVVGNPFQPLAFDARWRTAEVVTMARSIDAERAFDRMPALADALERNGCAVGPVLEHCRGGGAHVRGCWVIDLILDRPTGGRAPR